MSSVREDNAILHEVVRSHLGCHDIAREGARDSCEVAIEDRGRCLDLHVELPALRCGPDDGLVGCTLEDDTAARSRRVSRGRHRAELDVDVVDSQDGGVHGRG